jgi:hypothetical protein
LPDYVGQNARRFIVASSQHQGDQRIARQESLEKDGAFGGFQNADNTPAVKRVCDQARAPLVAELLNNFQHHGLAVTPPEGKQRGIRLACFFNGEAPGVNQCC